MTFSMFQSLYARSLARTRRGLRAALLVAALGLIAAGCAAPPRPTLVTPPGPTPETPLQLDLAPAPETVAPLPPASADLTLESSVDDAVLSWALERNVPYVDSCARVTPEPNELCDSPTSRDTVRLLGPSSDNIWYVLTIEEVSSLDIGAGFRVSDVQIAGR